MMRIRAPLRICARILQFSVVFVPRISRIHTANASASDILIRNRSLRRCGICDRAHIGARSRSAFLYDARDRASQISAGLSRGGQSLISTGFHVLTIRGIQVDGR